MTIFWTTNFKENGQRQHLIDGYQQHSKMRALANLTIERLCCLKSCKHEVLTKLA